MNEGTAEYTNPAAQPARKEIPYSASRVYLPREDKFENGTLLTLPSGARYVRDANGALRRVKRIEPVIEEVKA